jgi:hypothetical protein
MPPPSWEPGGRGVTEFEGRRSGDGRWFFVTGGCWFIRTGAVRAMDWPDPRLVKAADDVLMGEAIRQQGWAMDDIGALGVAISGADRRGGGEGCDDLDRMMVPLPPAAPAVPEPPPRTPPRGCLAIPTFRDADRLEAHFGRRAGWIAPLDCLVIDDNFEPAESARVRALCARHGWRHRPTGRPAHRGWLEDAGDLSSFNRALWEALTSLADDYDYVVKMDTDACLLGPAWHEEMARRLAGRAALLGTPELRPARDGMAFWELARRRGVPFDLEPSVAHLQGGIVGLGRGALLRLRAMGFLDGPHAGFAEDVYLSYCCRALGIPLERAETVGSWYAPYRPSSASLLGLKAVHPAAPEDSIAGVVRVG